MKVIRFVILIAIMATVSNFAIAQEAYPLETTLQELYEQRTQAWVDDIKSEEEIRDQKIAELEVEIEWLKIYYLQIPENMRIAADELFELWLAESLIQVAKTECGAEPICSYGFWYESQGVLNDMQYGVFVTLRDRITPSPVAGLEFEEWIAEMRTILDLP